MKKVLVTFGGAAYDSITEQVVRDAPGFGVDEFWVYDDTWIEKHPFRKLNTWLWDHRSPLAAPGRGLCWYAFKPLILFDAMSKLVPGDVVAYIDADTKPIADISVLFDTAGMVTVRCDIHEHMRAIILVLDTPHFVMSDPAGAYSLGDLPQGHYVLKVWLDSRTTLERPVDLPPGSTVHIDFP